jgi:hypothetical protein
VTEAACATKAVIDNPNKQKAIREMDFLRGPTGENAEFRFSIAPFIEYPP